MLLAAVLAPLAPLALGGARAPAGAAPNPIPRRALWIEPGANLPQLSTVQGVRAALDRAKAAGIDTVIPEAKNAWGYVIYPSTFLPTIGTSPMAHSGPGGAYPPPPQWYPRGYDMLGTIVREAHARGIKVDAAIHTFGEGYTPLHTGAGFTHEGFQAVAYVGFRRVTAPDGTSYELAGVDVPRGEDQLVLYTAAGGTVSPASRWGVDAAVGPDGAVAEVRDRAAGPADPGPVAIPAQGYVLSGHGAAAAWMRAALTAGAHVAIGPVATRLEPSSEHSIFAFANPANPEVWNYELATVREIVADYDLDGIVLDKTRYDDLTQDFSDASRTGFEQFIGRRVEHWPEDIYTYVPQGYWVARREGPLYRQWLGYRAHTIMAYTRAAAEVARTVRPGITVGMYVGSWYPVYYNEGVNWASPDIRAPYAWVSDAWMRASVLPYLDYLMMGLYYRPVTMWEAIRRHDGPTISVQGAAIQGEALVHGAVPALGAVDLEFFGGRAGDLRRAVGYSDAITHGTMVFDLIYLNTLNLWEAVTPPRAEP
jgi:uncharacterized lipoprotein YddW (UPF0748 family)